MTPLVLLDFAAAAALLGSTALTTAFGFGLMRTRASSYLTAFFACLAIATSSSTIILGWREWLSIDAVRWLRAVDVPSVYLLGPLLYGYVIALTSSARPFTGRNGIRHALPFIAALVFSLGNAVFALDAAPTGRLISDIVLHAWVLQGVPYLCVAAWRTYDARPLLEQISADEAALRLAWLRRLVVVIGVAWILGGIYRIPRVSGTPEWPALQAAFDWLITLAFYFLSWFGLRQRILIPVELAALEPIADEGAPARYARSGLDAAQSAQIAADLIVLMETERLYTDDGFDLRALSRRSGWPSGYVSQALNQSLRQNFFEFVNGFRIAAAETCLSDPNDRRTILDVALACGFGSKSTFNTVFKRMTGRTPGEFRRTRSSSLGEA